MNRRQEEKDKERAKKKNSENLVMNKVAHGLLRGSSATVHCFDPMWSGQRGAW